MVKRRYKPKTKEKGNILNARNVNINIKMYDVTNGREKFVTNEIY